MHNRPRLTIGISGINAVDNPGPGIAVARSLREDAGLKKDYDLNLVGLAYDAMEPGVYMDWVIDQSVLMPYPSANGESYYRRLIDLRDRIGLNMIIPNLDAELPFYTKFASRLEVDGIRTYLPTLSQFAMRGKDRLVQVALDIGLKVPKTHCVTNVIDLHEAMSDIGAPVMIKGVYYKSYRANNLSEATQHFHHLVADWGYPIIVQEIIQGAEANVVGLGDGQGHVNGMVAVKKSWVTETGKMWSGVTIQHEAAREAASKFVSGSKWRGPFELECMTQADDVYLIEINPRFPAWIYLATGVGINLPAAMIRTIMNETVQLPEHYDTGKMFIRYSYDMVTDMSRFQQMMTQGGTLPTHLTLPTLPTMDASAITSPHTPEPSSTAQSLTKAQA